MKLTVEEKLLARSVRDEATGCLRWTGAHNPQGYGQVVVYNTSDGPSRRQMVHRAAHELWIGPIPDGLEVDHVKDRGCAYRDCIEPSHLEAVTHRENLLRSDNFIGRCARATHCLRGHLFDDANTHTLRGRRICLRCRNHARAEARAAQRASKP